MAGGDTGNGNMPPDADAPPVTQSIRVVRKASKPTGIRQVGKATKAIPASGPADPPTVSAPVVLPLKEHARVWMALAGMLGILLIAALVIVGYLWNVNGKWQAQVEALTATGYDLGDRIADHQAQIEQLRSANDLLTDQLAAAKDRVLTLSNEKAQSSDNAAYAQQQVDLLVGQISSAQDVVAQLNRCIDGHEQLVTYIRDPEQFPPAQVTEFETSVQDLCDAAITANTEFQQSIAQ